MDSSPPESTSLHNHCTSHKQSEHQDPFKPESHIHSHSQSHTFHKPNPFSSAPSQEDDYEKDSLSSSTTVQPIRPSSVASTNITTPTSTCSSSSNFHSSSSSPLSKMIMWPAAEMSMSMESDHEMDSHSSQSQSQSQSQSHSLANSTASLADLNSTAYSSSSASLSSNTTSTINSNDSRTSPQPDSDRELEKAESSLSTDNSPTLNDTPSPLLNPSASTLSSSSSSSSSFTSPSAFPVSFASIVSGSSSGSGGGGGISPLTRSPGLSSRARFSLTQNPRSILVTESSILDPPSILSASSSSSLSSVSTSTSSGGGGGGGGNPTTTTASTIGWPPRRKSISGRSSSQLLWKHPSPTLRERTLIRSQETVNESNHSQPSSSLPVSSSLSSSQHAPYVSSSSRFSSHTAAVLALSHRNHDHDPSPPPGGDPEPSGGAISSPSLHNNFSSAFSSASNSPVASPGTSVRRLAEQFLNSLPDDSPAMRSRSISAKAARDLGSVVTDVGGASTDGAIVEAGEGHAAQHHPAITNGLGRGPSSHRMTTLSKLSIFEPHPVASIKDTNRPEEETMSGTTLGTVTSGTSSGTVAKAENVSSASSLESGASSPDGGNSTTNTVDFSSVTGVPSSSLSSSSSSLPSTADDSTGWQQLHDDIAMFGRVCFIDQQNQSKLREELVTRTQCSIHAVWPTAVVDLVGSVAANVALPKSDLDFVIYFPPSRAPPPSYSYAAAPSSSPPTIPPLPSVVLTEQETTEWLSNHPEDAQTGGAGKKNDLSALQMGAVQATTIGGVNTSGHGPAPGSEPPLIQYFAHAGTLIKLIGGRKKSKLLFRSTKIQVFKDINLIRLRDGCSGISMDLWFPVDLNIVNRSQRHTALIQTYLQSFPHFFALSAVIKTFMQQNLLNSGYSGLGSYGVLLMMVRYLQHQRQILKEEEDEKEKYKGKGGKTEDDGRGPPAPKGKSMANEKNLGKILVDFFRFYATFDYANKAVTVVGDGAFIDKPAVLHPQTGSSTPAAAGSVSAVRKHRSDSSDSEPKRGCDAGGKKKSSSSRHLKHPSTSSNEDEEEEEEEEDREEEDVEEQHYGDEGGEESDGGGVSSSFLPGFTGGTRGPSSFPQKKESASAAKKRSLANDRFTLVIQDPQDPHNQIICHHKALRNMVTAFIRAVQILDPNNRAPLAVPTELLVGATSNTTQGSGPSTPPNQPSLATTPTTSTTGAATAGGGAGGGTVASLPSAGPGGSTPMVPSSTTAQVSSTPFPLLSTTGGALPLHGQININPHGKTRFHRLIDVDQARRGPAVKPCPSPACMGPDGVSVTMCPVQNKVCFTCGFCFVKPGGTPGGPGTPGVGGGNPVGSVGMVGSGGKTGMGIGMGMGMGGSISVKSPVKHGMRGTSTGGMNVNPVSNFSPSYPHHHPHPMNNVNVLPVPMSIPSAHGHAQGSRIGAPMYPSPSGAGNAVGMPNRSYLNMPNVSRSLSDSSARYSRQQQHPSQPMNYSGSNLYINGYDSIALQQQAQVQAQAQAHAQAQAVSLAAAALNSPSFTSAATSSGIPLMSYAPLVYSMPSLMNASSGVPTTSSGQPSYLNAMGAYNGMNLNMNMGMSDYCASPPTAGAAGSSASTPSPLIYGSAQPDYTYSNPTAYIDPSMYSNLDVLPPAVPATSYSPYANYVSPVLSSASPSSPVPYFGSLNPTAATAGAATVAVTVTGRNGMRNGKPRILTASSLDGNGNVQQIMASAEGINANAPPFQFKQRHC